MILFGIINYSFFFFLLILFSFFFSILYSIWLPNRIIFGNIRNNYGYNFDLDDREFFTLIIFFVVNLYMGIFPSEFLSIINF